MKQQTTTESGKPSERIQQEAADLYWLAYLLTGNRDISIDIATDCAVSENAENPFFTDWVRGWRRRLAIGKALNAIHEELDDSARRTERAHFKGSAAPRNWRLSPEATKADVEKALLAIDVFPRAAVLLLVFEGEAMADVATLLDADPALVKKAQAIGLQELTANLAGAAARGEPDVLRLGNCQ